MSAVDAGLLGSPELPPLWFRVFQQVTSPLHCSAKIPCCTGLTERAHVGCRRMDPVQPDNEGPAGMLDGDSTTGAVHHRAAGCDVGGLTDVTEQAHSSQEGVPQEALPQEGEPQEALPQEAVPQEALLQQDTPQEPKPGTIV